MSGRISRSGLVLPAAAASAVALAATAEPRAAPILLAAALVAAAVCLVVALRGGGVLPMAAAVTTALVSGAVLLGDAARHPAALELGRPVAIEVEIASTAPARGSGGALTVVRGTIRAVRTARGRVEMAVPAVLFTDGRVTAAPGATASATVVLRRTQPIDQAAVAGPVRGRLRSLGAAPPVEAWGQSLRSRFLTATAALPGDGGALLPGLAIGDTSRVDAGLQQAMRAASLTHLTAVSGANCAVVVLGVLALAAQARIPRVPRMVLAGAALALFVVLVTPQPSVVRAAVMTAVGLGCALTGRRTAGLPALAATVLVLLLLDPWIVWSAGFVLSVAATAGLLLLAPPLADRLATRLPRRLALLLAVPVAAQAASQPVLVLLQPGIPLFGVVANLLAEPAAPVATVLGLVACLAAPPLPALAGGLALLAWLPAAWIGVVARVLGALPQLDWPQGVAGAALAAVLIACVLVGLRRRTPGRLRAGAAVLAAVAVVALLGVTAGGAIGRSAGTPRAWTLAACDVGQGDGLVLNGGGRFAVVDTGRDPGPVLSCLDRLGVRRIDLLVLTHWDADHVGGVEALAGRVRTALVGPADGPNARRLLGVLRRAGAGVVQARRGDALQVGALRLDVLWPVDGVEPGNGAGVTLQVTGSGPSLLLTADLDAQAQAALLEQGPLPRFDVVKVAHHGSSDQSPGLYAAAGAALAVISAGAGNDYGHPTAPLLRILRSVGAAAVRTDQDGLILVARRGGRLLLWTERPVTAAVWTPAK